MAGGIDIKIDVRNIGRMRNMLARLTKKTQSRRDLHMRWAILGLNWVTKNFDTEGGKVGGWAPLSPNTLVGRRGGSGRILQNRGAAGLKGSFQGSWTSEHATVGSPMKIALFHEKGTRPYPITPKNAPYLKFKVADVYGVKIRTLKSGKKMPPLQFAELGGWISTKLVKHPGLPARRMLPRGNEPDLLRDLLIAGRNYLKLKEEGNG